MAMTEVDTLIPAWCRLLSEQVNRLSLPSEQHTIFAWNLHLAQERQR